MLQQLEVEFMPVTHTVTLCRRPLLEGVADVGSFASIPLNDVQNALSFLVGPNPASFETKTNVHIYLSYFVLLFTPKS